MISNFVKYELSDSTKGSINSKRTRKSLILKYPCTDTYDCTPYKLTINPGTYKFECWGSKGSFVWIPSYPGKGAYTKGSIALFKKTEMFIYIGSTGHFNSYMNKSYVNSELSGGGATDVRLKYSQEWFDTEGLKSRIMVAAGGGGAEWYHAVGGNGGGLEGGESTSYTHEGVALADKCKGGLQTSGSTCVKYESYGIPYSGVFGAAGTFVSPNNDWGGIGGGGYYGGTSYNTAYAGSGGSSFISGHDGCKAILPTEGPIIEHSNQSFHYSGFVFQSTEMIPGNQTMPLPIGGKGIWDEDHGAFKITIVSFEQRTNHCHRHHLTFCFFLVQLSSE